MHWTLDAASRTAERDERKALELYMKVRRLTLSEVWVEVVGEASRRADAALRLERRLGRMG